MQPGSASMQGTRATRAKGVEHKHGNVDIKFFTIFSYTKITAMHGAGGCAQARTAGVVKFFTGL